MHEIAETRSGALPSLILSATSFSEVSNGCQFCVDRSASKPTIVEVIASFQCIIFLLELDIDIANQMVTEVVTNIHFLNLTIFILTLNKDILKEVVIMFLHLLISDIG